MFSLHDKSIVITLFELGYRKFEILLLREPLVTLHCWLLALA